MSPVDRLEREIVAARPMCVSFLVRQFDLSEEDAEDVFQVAFMRAARRLRQGSFKYKSSATTWFLQIAKNVALDRIRSPAAKMCSLDALEGGDSAAAEKSWREPILGADCNRFFQPIPAPFALLCAA
jgi:RNA polymerase sigma factor (sigma-70 family)